MDDTVSGAVAARPSAAAQVAILLWALLPVLALFGRAIVSLTPHALEALRAPELGAAHIAFTVVWIAFMAFAEGYRGFQRSFAPRVVSRAFGLARAPRTVDLIFAPLYAIGYYHAPKRTMIVAWSVTLGVIALILAVVFFAKQPWRGLIDTGVIIGLGWGVVAIVVLAIRHATTRK